MAAIGWHEIIKHLRALFALDVIVIVFLMVTKTGALTVVRVMTNTRGCRCVSDTRNG